MEIVANMDYTVTYLLARTFGRAVRDRDLAVFAMLWGFATAKAKREPVYEDREVRDYLRRQQRIRHLPHRMPSDSSLLDSPVIVTRSVSFAPTESPPSK